MMYGQSGPDAMGSDELSNNQSVDDQLAELQKEYIANLNERVQPVVVLWQKYIASNYAADVLSDVYRGVHAIAGTSSILNISPIDTLSNRAQIQIQSVMQAEEFDAAAVEGIGVIINEMIRVASSGEVNAPPINLNG
ncbi:hypothetical protein [Zhongshania sp.]|uniref:hypothetical protein n=1 Tax=Zhongshania sp. TaxID=1971902 RepID=UPI0035689270